MKKVSAIIHSHKLDEVKLALLSVGVVGMTVSETRKFGRSKGLAKRYRGNEYKVDFSSKITIEAVIDDEIVSQVVEQISLAARTGKLAMAKFLFHQLIKLFASELERKILLQFKVES